MSSKLRMCNIGNYIFPNNIFLLELRVSSNLVIFRITLTLRGINFYYFVYNINKRFFITNMFVTLFQYLDHILRQNPIELKEFVFVGLKDNFYLTDVGGRLNHIHRTFYVYDSNHRLIFSLHLNQYKQSCFDPMNLHSKIKIYIIFVINIMF